MFKSFLSVFRRTDDKAYMTLVYDVVAKSGLDVAVSVVDTMPKEVSDKEASYNLMTKELLINRLVFSTKYKTLAISQYGSLEVYIDVLVSHELGHAYDPNAQSLMLMAGNRLAYTSDVRREALLLAEKNAWIYGRRFTSYPEMYEHFNKINYKCYEESFFF